MAKETRVFKKPQGLDGSGITFISPKSLADSNTKGTVVEGVFKEVVKNKFGLQDYKFITEDGNTVIVNRCGSLDYQMKNVSPGEFVQLNYTGKIILENGPMKGKESHQFEVLVASEA